MYFWCTNIFEIKNKYVGIFKTLKGIYYCLPLIDSVNFGDRITLYKSARRYLTRLQAGSISPLCFLQGSFLLSNVGLIQSNFACAAGTYITIKLWGIKYCLIILPSLKTIFIPTISYGLIGRNSGIFTNKQICGKASISLKRTNKIIVRSTAKNPVDHPNGGRTRGKQLFKTPWGRVAKYNK